MAQDLVRGGRFGCRVLTYCERGNTLFLLVECFGAHGEDRAGARDAGNETAASRQGCGQLGASACLFRCLAMSQFLPPNRAGRTSHTERSSG